MNTGWSNGSCAKSMSRRRVAAQPFVAGVTAFGMSETSTLRIEVRHDHDLAQRSAASRRSARTRSSESCALAVVAVAVGAEQHLRLDLAEAVEHALDAEVRRARGPDDALRERGEREHAGFGNVRE